MQSMSGPYPLTLKGIDDYVMSAVPGNFLLGEIVKNHFKAQIVGRADDCLNARLKEQAGKFPFFKFSYALTRSEAFLKQCRLYHELLHKHTQEDWEHPVSPDLNLPCPYCHYPQAE